MNTNDKEFIEFIETDNDYPYRLSPVLKKDLFYEDHDDPVMNGRRLARRYIVHIINLIELYHYQNDMNFEVGYSCTVSFKNRTYKPISDLIDDIYPLAMKELSRVCHGLGYTDDDIEILKDMR